MNQYPELGRQASSLLMTFGIERLCFWLLTEMEAFENLAPADSISSGFAIHEPG
jgi:hypothetical protein